MNIIHKMKIVYSIEKQVNNLIRMAGRTKKVFINPFFFPTTKNIRAICGDNKYLVKD